MPKDENQRAVAVVALATAEDAPAPKPKKRRKNPAAVALGRLGGKKGGRARAESLSAERRSEIAKSAAKARWRATARNARSRG